MRAGWITNPPTMETSEEISHPSFRRALRYQERLSVEKPELSEPVRPRLARSIARIFAVFSSLAWRATSDLSRTGFARMVSHATILALVLGVLWISSQTNHSLGTSTSFTQNSGLDRNILLTQSTAQSFDSFNLYAYAGGPLLIPQSSIVRQADPFTFIPDRPRRGIVDYAVQPGDVLFAIANRFGVTPESVLWNNEDVLDNDPHQILPGTVLRIPPVSGVIHTIVEGDTLESIAEQYKVSVDAILVDGAQWNETALLAGKFPQIGSTLIVPGGQREFEGWALPEVNTPSNTVAGARPVLGSCGSSITGSLRGSSSFIWPSNNHWISGYNFSAWHPGLDVAGRSGDPVYAADNGFVVYAGWSNVGYGNLVVIDHGNGWQTWYAHLSLILVTCGQDVWQGSTIGGIGSTGHSSGPHLHFEMRNQGTYANPWNILPPS